MQRTQNKKNEILKAIKKCVNDYGQDYDLTYDEQAERLFCDIFQILETPFSVYLRNDGQSEYWLQVEYYSNKIRKTIIWDYDLRNFDDYDEVVDFIINTTKEIKSFERKLTKIK